MTTLLDEPDVRAAPAAEAPGCAACPHPIDDHDAIAQRYCRATVAAELDRGCACRSS